MSIDVDGAKTEGAKHPQRMSERLIPVRESRPAGEQLIRPLVVESGATGTPGEAMDARGVRGEFAGDAQGEPASSAWPGRLGPYGLALLFVGVAALSRWAMPEVLRASPFLIFYLAWVGAAAFGGLGPGLLATAASWLCIDLLFDSTIGRIDFTDGTSVQRLLIFLGGGLLVSAIGEKMRRSRTGEHGQGTELAQLARSLAREKEILQAVMNGAGNSHLIYLDRDFKFVCVNETCARTAGYTSDELIGRNLFALYPDAENEAIFTRVRDTGQAVEFHDTPFVFPNRPERGTTYWDWMLTPIKSHFGMVEGLVLSLVQTTRRKRAEQALREANDHLERNVEERTAELQQTNERLRDENRQRIGTERSLRLEEARLDALFQLSRMDTASLKEITGFALEQGIRLTHSKIGFLGFLNAEESVYTLHAVSKDVVKECNVTGDPLQWHVVDAGIWAEAIRERKTLFVNDYGEPHPRKRGLPPGHPAVERFMIVPIFEGGRIIALAGVGNKASDYEKSDERQVVLLLTGMWGYVQRNRSREELRRAYEELEEKVKQRTAELAASAAALQESQTDLNRALEVGQIGSWRLDVRQNILSWSDETHRIFGVPKGAPLTYETFLDIVHPDDRQTVDTRWKRSLNGAPYDLEHRIVVDGRVKWVREKAYLEFDETGELRGSFGITQDITDRRQAEQAVRESEARFRILATNLSSGVALIDEDGKFALYNPAFLTMFGLADHSSIRDVNDQSWGEWQVFEQDGTLLHVDDHPVRKAALTGRAVRNKLVGVRLPSAGDLRWMLISAEPIPQADGRRAIICTYHDVTERKRAEDALRELNATLESKVAQRTEELEHRAWQLQKLTLELTEAEERERQRLAEILHDDLQQVLAAAKFQMGLLSSRARTAAESQEIAGRARDLLTDAIAKSRSLSHKLSTPALAQADLNEVFEWLAEQMQKEQGFTVQLETEGRLEVPSGPLRILLYKAAREFLFNVIKHAGVREARLRLRRHGGRLRLTVSDRGRGFDPNEPGYTLGFGVLSIRERLGMVGGRLRIRSIRDRGSTFAIVVPCQE